MPRGAMTPLPEQFKAAFRLHPAGVALVVGATPTGPVGLTASSVASVSASPPMLSFSLARTGATAAALIACTRLRVVLLGEHDAAVAADFARSGAPRFTSDQGWVEGDDLPVLKSAPATFTVRTHQVVPAGGSWLVLADVTSVDFGPPARPLVHYDRAYWPLGGSPLEGEWP